VSFAGTGTVSPGWSSVVEPQSFVMSGEGVMAVDEPSAETAAANCDFFGTDTGTITEGAGDIEGSCDADSCGSEQMRGTFERVDGAMMITGTMSVGCADEEFEASCEIEPAGFDTSDIESSRATAFEINCEFKSGPKGVAGLAGTGSIRRACRWSAGSRRLHSQPRATSSRRLANQASTVCCLATSPATTR